MDKVWNIFWRIATILYFGDWDRRFLLSPWYRDRDSLISHKIHVPSLLLAPCQSLLVLRSHDVPLSIKFFSFAPLKLSRFRSNPLVSGNCLERKFYMKHEFSLHSRYCSLKFLREISKLCEVNVIGKNVWFIQILSLFYYFHSSTRHYSITSSLIIV